LPKFVWQVYFDINISQASGATAALNGHTPYSCRQKSTETMSVMCTNDKITEQFQILV